MVTITSEHRSSVGANRRFVVGMEDGASVEAVLYREDSLCISSQVGCAVGCPFCASGANGLARNLSLEELIGQVKAVDSVSEHSPRITRVTLSGVGEPLHNPVVPEFVTWCRKRGTPASLTTSGGPLRRLAEWLSTDGPPHNGISLSIHAGSEATRAQVVPRGPALGPLFDLLTEALPKLSSHRRRKLALAYLLLADQNDDDSEIDAFLDRATPLGIKVHLYRYNPVPTSDQGQTTEDRYREVFERMRERGLDVRRSSQARIEDNGGCGTLVAAASLARLRAPRP